MLGAAAVTTTTSSDPERVCAMTRKTRWILGVSDTELIVSNVNPNDTRWSTMIQNLMNKLARRNRYKI